MSKEKLHIFSPLEKLEVSTKSKLNQTRYLLTSLINSLLTCIWSPASTMRVVLLARAKGMMVSHSMA